MMRLIMLAALVTVPSAGLAAKPQQKRAAAFEALLACRAIADSAEKFACLDRTSAALEAAANAGELVVFDRQQVKETKKTLFGFDIPNLRLFADEDKDEVKSVEGKIGSAYANGNGQWVIRLADGATWQQIDDSVLGRRPRQGMDVKISRGVVGSYKMTVGGQPAIKVRRSN
jgi:hypothetical protein